MSSQTYVNRFGRKGGRGIRPWILLPKVLAVGLYLGGLAAATGIWVFRADERAQGLWLINLVGGLMEYLVIPALLAAMALGVMLFMQHPWQFIRMRWMIVKLASLAVLIPSAHVYCSTRLAAVRQALEAGAPNPAAGRQLAWGLGLALAGSVGVVVLGRLKPRLGQNWARTYGAMAPSRDGASGGEETPREARGSADKSARGKEPSA